MKKEKEIPLKNYILLSIVLILTIVVVIYFFLWKNTYEKSKLQTPILDDYLLVINYNELNNYLVENKDAIIYVSKLNDESIRLFENKFKNIINKNKFDRICRTYFFVFYRMISGPKSQKGRQCQNELLSCKKSMSGHSSAKRN